jgi:hypothetical protein
MQNSQKGPELKRKRRPLPRVARPIARSKSCVCADVGLTTPPASPPGYTAARVTARYVSRRKEGEND